MLSWPIYFLISHSHSVRNVISRSKFIEQICSQAAEQIFWIHRLKAFLLMCMRKQMMNICLPIYNNERQSSLIAMSSRWQKIAPACASAGGLHPYRPADDSRVLRLWTPPCTRTSTRKSYPRAGKLSAQRHYPTAEMHITQAVRFINIRLRISVYRKWALRLKFLIFYSQKFYRTKFLSFRKRRNRPLFWPWLTVHQEIDCLVDFLKLPIKF